MNAVLFALAACLPLLAASDDPGDVARARPPYNRGQVVVARVNGEPVSGAELRRMLGNPLTRNQLERAAGSQPVAGELERFALQKLIHHRLLLQEAARRNIEVTRQDLDQAVAALRRRFDDLESLGKWMKDQGLDDKGLYEALRGDMLAGRVWAALVEGVRVTEEQALEYWELHKDELVGGEEVRLRVIAVRDKAAADEILASLKKGESFGQLARRRSEGRRAAQGGSMGWVNVRQLQEPLATAVPQLKPGDVAGPLDNGSGEFLLVGLEARRPVAAKTMAEARPEIERRLLPANQEAAVAAWLASREKQSTVEILYASKER
jgi:peptidyl-prolyl cis-trans isomerase SurA